LEGSFHTIEGLLKIGFIISAVFASGYANTLAFFTCLLGFFRKCGRPYATAEYGK